MSEPTFFAKRLRAAGAGDPFDHDGVTFTEGVPDEVLQAYAVGRMAGSPADVILLACVVAYAGPGSCIPDEDPKRWPIIWLCARAWCARCGALERAVRGIAVRSINEGREARHV